MSGDKGKCILCAKFTGFYLNICQTPPLNFYIYLLHKCETSPTYFLCEILLSLWEIQRRDRSKLKCKVDCRRLASQDIFVTKTPLKPSYNIWLVNTVIVTVLLWKLWTCLFLMVGCIKNNIWWPISMQTDRKHRFDSWNHLKLKCEEKKIQSSHLIYSWTIIIIIAAITFFLISIS